MRDRFKRARLEDLTDRELMQLRNTLAARREKTQNRKAVDTI